MDSKESCIKVAYVLQFTIPLWKTIKTWKRAKVGKCNFLSKEVLVNVELSFQYIRMRGSGGILAGLVKEKYFFVSVPKEDWSCLKVETKVTGFLLLIF